MNYQYPVTANIPPELKEALQRYLDDHPGWSLDRTLTSALSLFLLQNGTPMATRTYLDTLFKA